MSSTLDKKVKKPRKPKAAVAVAAPQPVVAATQASAQVETQTVIAQQAPVAAEPVAETVVTHADELVEDEPIEKPIEGKKKKRKEVAYAELRTDLDAVVNQLLADISSARSAKNKDLVNTLKGYEKSFKKARNDVKKVEPKKKKESAESDAPTQQSGFNKPQAVTGEIATFANWNASELKSRTDITKALCDYVKQHNLQNPENKRQILPDARLAAILRYNPDNGALTYSTMQKNISHLFVPEEKVQA